jgi:hypothetical protein
MSVIKERDKKQPLEWEYLRDEIKKKYGIKTMTNPKQFEKLEDDLEKLRINSEHKATSDEQLKNFFFMVDEPDEWLIKRLYVRLFEKERDDFWKDEACIKNYEEFSENYKSPEEVRVIRTVLQNSLDAEKADKEDFEKKLNAETVEKGELQKKLNAETADKDKFKTYTFALLISSIFCLMGLIYFANSYFQTAKKLEETAEKLKKMQTFFYTKDSVNKAELLKKDLFFLDDASNSTFLAVVDSLVLSLMYPDKYADANALSIIYDNEQNIDSNHNHLIKHNTMYDCQQIGLMRPKDTTTLHTDLIKGMASTLGRLYRGTDKKIGANNLVENDLVPRLVGINNTGFDADLIYVAYKRDILDTQSAEFMFRYPRYIADPNYSFIQRQFWKESTKPKDANDEIHWEHKVKNSNGLKVQVGISKPYVTARKNTPIHRAFWVDVPIDTPSKTKMILTIDLFMNN